MTEMITSRLWKARLLCRESTFFPHLVEAAAWAVGAPYDDSLVRGVAEDPDVLDAIEMPRDEGADAILTDLASSRGEELDAVIVNAVSRLCDIAPVEEEGE